MSDIRVTNIIGENGSNPVGLSTGFTVGPTSGTTGIGVTITHQGHAQFAGVCTATSFSGSGDTNTKITFPAADTITAETGGTERIRVDSSGRILIGTTTEGSTVIGDDFTLNRASGNCGITIRTNSSSTGSLVFSDATSGTAEYAGFIQYQHNNGKLVLGAGGGEKLLIDSNGNVTKPTNFHILVQRSGNQTGYNASSLSAPVIWNSVVTGESSTGASSHFDTSTGLFTAPVTGMYHFHASVNCNFDCEGGWIILDGSRPSYAAFYPNNTQSADGHLIYHITAGQTVGLKWYDNGNTNATINANTHHTWWRIILLG